jgi:RNA polymerase sigma factor (TIGR02999 family)
VTQLLQRVNQGDQRSEGELFELVYSELRRVASQLMHGERKAHTLQATALVHEVWIRLLGPGADDSGGTAIEWEGRRHFLSVAARAMRNLLVDHARARTARKRDAGRQRIAVDEMIAVYEDSGVDILALSEALEGLAQIDSQLARLVELRFFGGLEYKQVADVLGMSLRSAERGWFTARAYLRGVLGEE